MNLLPNTLGDPIWQVLALVISMPGGGHKSEISRSGRVDLAQFLDRRCTSKTGIGGSLN